VAASALPSSSTSGLNDTLIATNARVGEELAWWGLRLLILCFIGLAIAAVLKALSAPAGAGGLAQGGGGPGAVLEAILRAVPDLIKTPAGIGALILILGVLMLLATAAIDTQQLKDFGGGSTEASAAPSAEVSPAPAESPSEEPASVAPASPCGSAALASIGGEPPSPGPSDSCE
jgi:hypothetical protein